MNKLKTIALIVIVLFSSAGFAQSVELFSAQEGAFKAQFPGTPEHSVETNVSQYGKIWQNVYIYADGPQAWMIAYTDYPEGMLEGQTADEVLNQGVIESLSTLGIVAPSQLDTVAVKGFQGRSFTGSEGRNHVYFKLILVNDRLYQLTILRLDDWPEEGDVETFFDSFQLPEGAKPKLNRRDVPSADLLADVYQSEAGRFEIDFPGEPVVTSDTVSADVGEVKMYSYQFEDRSGVAYMVSYADYPQAIVDTRDKREMLQNGKRTVIGSMGLSALDREEEMMLGDHPGLDFRGHSDTYYVAFRVFMVGNRLYQIAMMKEGEYVDSEIRDRFIESFSLLAP